MAVTIFTALLFLLLTWLMIAVRKVNQRQWDSDTYGAIVVLSSIWFVFAFIMPSKTTYTPSPDKAEAVTVLGKSYVGVWEPQKGVKIIENENNQPLTNIVVKQHFNYFGLELDKKHQFKK